MDTSTAGGHGGGPQPGRTCDSTPYQTAASLYRDAGWHGVLPVRGKSDGIPAGFTGHRGRWPTEDEITDWKTTRGTDNIALRLPRSVIGIDVDAHSGKRGAETLEHFISIYGDLPETWYTTARDDESRLLLYRVPEGAQEFHWVSDLGHGSNVEIIRHAHRYALVWPSVHPGSHADDPARGCVYRWWRPDGPRHWITADTVPQADALAVLPDTWTQCLHKSSRSAHGTIGRSVLSPGGVSAVGLEPDRQSVDPELMLLTGAQPGEQNSRMFAYLCSLRTKHLSRDEAAALGMIAVQRMTNSRPEDPWTVEHVVSMVSRVWDAYEPGTTAQQRQRRRSASGNGVRTIAEDTADATSSAFSHWVHGAVGGTSTDDTPTDATSSQDDVRPPVAESVLEGAPRGGRESCTDSGNALRLARLLGPQADGDHLLRYVPEHDRWHLWNGARWRVDVSGRALALTALVADDIRRPENADDDDEAAAFAQWAHRSESYGARTAMLALAASLPEMQVSASDLDTDPRLIACDNGVVELLDDGWTFRPGRPDDRLSLNTGVSFDATARDNGDASALWNDFIAYVQPDGGLRRQLQALDGYTLLGGNPLRYWIILRGPTTSGKTTHLECTGKALGDYSSAVNMSIFRGNFDERARADIIRAMDRRRIHMSEMEAGTSLHADQIKRLTGGDSLTARPPHGREYVTRVPAFVPLTAMNGVPRIEDADQALQTRIRVVPFATRMDRDTTGRMWEISDVLKGPLDDALKNVILLWMLEGWSLYRAGALDDGTVEGDTARAEFVQEYLPLNDFISEYCETDGSYSDTAESLFLACQCWESETGVPIGERLSSRRLGTMLAAQGYVCRKRVWVEDADGTRRQRTVWHGLRVRAEHADRIALRRMLRT